MSTFHLQGLEELFDRRSRRRLDAFIVLEGAGSKNPKNMTKIKLANTQPLSENTTFCYAAYALHLSGSASEVEELEH